MVKANTNFDQAVAYQWTLAEKNRTRCTLFDAMISRTSQAEPAFTPYAAVSYRLRVQAKADGETAPDTLDVQARITVATGDDKRVEDQQKVDLKAQTDLKADRSYQWTFANRHAASELADSDINKPHRTEASFTPYTGGRHALQVTATADGTTVRDRVQIDADRIWQTKGSAGFSPSLDVIFSTVSLALADDGTPFVAYVDNNEDTATVERTTPLAPRVTRIQPANGAKVDDSLIAVSALFDRPMKAATVKNTENFRVTDANGVVPQNGIDYYPGSYTAAVLLPRDNLTGEVTVELTDHIESKSGVPFPGRTWSFQVQ